MRKRTDSNQKEVFKVFRDMGCTVLNLSNVGACCDCLVAVSPTRQILIEIKDGSKPQSQRKLTRSEAKFHDEWKGELYIINNIHEAIALVNRCRKESASIKVLQPRCECHINGEPLLL